MKNLIRARLYDIRKEVRKYAENVVLTVSMSPAAHKEFISTLCLADLSSEDNNKPMQFEGASVIISQTQTEDWRVFQG